MDINFIISSVGVFLAVILLLVVILLLAKKFLSPSGKVTITINGDKQLNVDQGSSIMATLNENGIYLPSACGGKASCGQCKLQVLSGGGEILDSERPHFTRKQIKENWRLGCQCKVKGDMSVKVPESVMGVKEWECTVLSNKNVSSFIKEFKVALPPGEHMDFVPGSYAQIKIPAYDCIDYDKDFDKNDIGEDYMGAWKNFNIFSLKAHNPELHGQLSRRGRHHHPDGAYRHDAVQAASRGRIPGCADRYRFQLHLLLEAWRQGDDVGSLRRLPSQLRV